MRVIAVSICAYVRKGPSAFAAACSRISLTAGTKPSHVFRCDQFAIDVNAVLTHL